MRILEEAEEELKEATEYYENLEPGLGLRLLASATHCFQWIALHPTAPRIRRGCFRRVNLKVFPFYVPIKSTPRPCGSLLLHTHGVGRTIGEGENPKPNES